MAPETTLPLLRARGANTISLDPAIMRQVGLQMADGQIEQADFWLLVVAGYERQPRGTRFDPLERALMHLRSACKWLEAAAQS